MRKIKSKAQQEIAGFVIIVVLVVIVAVIFLLISLRKPASEVKNPEIDNLLSSLMKYTTGCAISYEPDYSSFQDLIKDCYNNAKCSNLNKDACVYLNETSQAVISDLIKSEGKVRSYEFEVYHQTSESKTEMVYLKENVCNGTSRGSQKTISVDSGVIIARLKWCY